MKRTRWTLGLLLWISTIACGEPIGTLAQLGTNRAHFLLPTGPQSFEIRPDQWHKLKHQGLGSRWEVFVREQSLESAILRGQDKSCQAALAALLHFVRLVNAADWAKAHACLDPVSRPTLPGFRARWSDQFVSAELDDWALISLTPQSVELQILSLQGGLEGEESSANPTLLKSTWRITGSGVSRWLIKEL